MGGLLGKVQEEEPEIEPEIDVYNMSFEEEASNNSDQSQGLDTEKMQKLMTKVKSTLEQNPHRKKNRKSTIFVVYYHRQNKKKNENGPMADGETSEDSSNTSLDNSTNMPLCPPGAHDSEPSAVTPRRAKAE